MGEVFGRGGRMVAEGRIGWGRQEGWTDGLATGYLYGEGAGCGGRVRGS